MATLNEVYLAGIVANAPDMQLGTGTPCATVRLCVIEEREGQQYKTLVPLEAWGKAADSIGEIEEGMAVLVRGRLRWKKTGEQPGTLVVSVWQVQPLVALAGSTLGGRV